jgi:hypothetical protein
LLLKHDNTCAFDGSHWDWSKSSVCDDAVFVASCINSALSEEIRWPSETERFQLGKRIAQFSGYVGLIDWTLYKIRRSYKDPNNRRWFNGRKKIYSVNNTVVVDHDGLFTYVDPDYCGSFHDVNILRNSSLLKNWREYFVHNDDYFEYLLGDPGYAGEDMFIMRRIGARENLNSGQTRFDDDENVSNALNKFHAGVHVRVEWGIGIMKRKWKHLMKRFDHTKERFPIYFMGCLYSDKFYSSLQDGYGCWRHSNRSQRRRERLGWGLLKGIS